MLPVIKLYSIFRNSFVESSFAGFEETYPSIVAGEMILARLDEIEPFFVSMIIPTVIADKELDRLVHQSANRFAVILAAAFVIKFSLMKCINSRTAETVIYERSSWKSGNRATPQTSKMRSETVVKFYFSFYFFASYRQMG